MGRFISLHQYGPEVVLLVEIITYRHDSMLPRLARATEMRESIRFHCFIDRG